MTKEELKKLYSEDDDTGCWHWHGSTHSTHGYAVAWYEGQSWRVVSLLWRLTKKPPLPRDQVLKRSAACPSDDCVRPSHYEVRPRDEHIQYKRYNSTTASQARHTALHDNQHAMTRE